ncbi:hypothetical protein ASE00_07220 [Sphingomonas sp. Root710]|uniref:sensor histidine kinase n=1 Tax=Sphingomonas sp. Root710 TaxID=1736594 RepID=UPI0006FE72F8|nr:HAMP domain-containing sensor histidine kinase [Sphingomonas sp. Root710]KRB86481.1 hypothetical protein ASE00_07220 [Sphingomonas sp. Root710]
MIRSTTQPLDGSRSFDEEIIPVNLRRTQIVGSVAAAMMLVEGALAIVRQNILLLTVALAGAALMFAFAVAAHLARRRSPFDRAVPLGFIVVLLIVAQLLAVTGSRADEQAYAYSIVLLGLAALFKVRPGIFGGIVLVTSVMLLGWIGSLHLPIGIALQSAGTALFAAVSAVLIRYLLYRARERDHVMRAIIAGQNRMFANANHELAQRNHDIRETMAIAAHDLRSPMSGLHGLLELAASRPDMPPDMLRSVFTEAGQSVADMLALIDKLLQAHEAEDRGAVDLRVHDLHALAAAAVERIGVRAGMAGVEFERLGQEPAILISTSDEAVAQILDNLLSNAVRYSPPGSTVRVACATVDGDAVVDVIDQGVGIAAEEQTRIFAKFQRGSRPPVAGGLGTGLGLYIAQRAALRISARLEYRQPASGGSIFRLTLPSMGGAEG